jgi:hypothetical protein
VLSGGSARGGQIVYVGISPFLRNVFDINGETNCVAPLGQKLAKIGLFSSPSSATVSGCLANYMKSRLLALTEKCSGMRPWQEKCSIIKRMGSLEFSLRRRINEKRFTRFFTD